MIFGLFLFSITIFGGQSEGGDRDLAEPVQPPRRQVRRGLREQQGVDIDR